jgi:hypothetical protein
MPACEQNQGVAIGACSRYGRTGQVTASASPGLDNHWLSQFSGQTLGHDACNRVCISPRGKTLYEGDGFVWKTLRHSQGHADQGRETKKCRANHVYLLACFK